MSVPAPRDPAGGALRVTILLALGAAPLALGAVHEAAFVPLLVVSFAAGLVSWARNRRASGAAAVPLPGRRALLALHALVLFQLLPLPPALLRLLSPGSFSFYNDHALEPLSAWRPVSVSPPDTLRGLVFLAGFTLLYGAVFREFGGPLWRRRLLRTVVGVGLVLTIVALVQAASAEPRRIYGLWRPAFDWAVFGPYLNRNHFAGYLVMAIPLALGFALEALRALRYAWQGRRVGWLALGGRAGNALVRRSAEAVVLVVGLLASRSRGGFMAFAVSSLALPLAARHRRQAAALSVLLAALGVAWIGLGGVIGAFESRGIQGSRLDLWRDMLPMIPRFALVGTGLNAFASAYPWYQTIWRTEWIGEAHNDYLQALLDLGVIGAALVASLLLLLFRRALGAARRGPLEIGLFGSLLGLAVHALVDFNWQVPANAATYVALAAIAVRTGGSLDPSRTRP